MELLVNNLKNLREAHLKGEKIVLYGPNGEGKSTLIHMAMLIVSKLGAPRSMYDDKVLPQYVFDEATASAQLDEISVELRRRNMVVKYKDGSYTIDVLSGEGVRLAEWSVWHITTDEVNYQGTPKICRQPAISYTPIEQREGLKDFAVTCPAIAQYIGYVHYDSMQTPIGWIPIRHLSYGEKRLLAMEVAIYSGDYVFIENFEAGLHVDFIKLLLDLIGEVQATVFIETHSGVVVKYALLKGYSVYKVERGSAVPITLDKLRDIGLFRREYEVYQSLI